MHCLPFIIFLIFHLGTVKNVVFDASFFCLCETSPQMTQVPQGLAHLSAKEVGTANLSPDSGVG